jgi:hypothetical protein
VHLWSVATGNQAACFPGPGLPPAAGKQLHHDLCQTALRLNGRRSPLTSVSFAQHISLNVLWHSLLAADKAKESPNLHVAGSERQRQRRRGWLPTGRPSGIVAPAGGTVLPQSTPQGPVQSAAAPTGGAPAPDHPAASRHVVHCCSSTERVESVSFSADVMFCKWQLTPCPCHNMVSH